MMYKKSVYEKRDLKFGTNKELPKYNTHMNNI